MRKRPIKREIYSGDFLRVKIYPVYSYTLPRKRKRKYKPTSEQQKRLNDKRSKEWLCMLLETNFQGEGYYLTLSYNNKALPLSDKEAEKEASKFIRRIKEQCKRKKVADPVAVWCTERGKKGRLHHHVIVKCGLTRDELENKWNKGYKNSKVLQFNENGLEGIARYLPKEPIGARRWHSTRNLQKPIEKKQIINQKQARDLADENITFETISKYYPDYILIKDSVNVFYDEISNLPYFNCKMYKRNSKYIK